MIDKGRNMKQFYILKDINGFRIWMSDVGSQIEAFKWKIRCKCILTYPVPEKSYRLSKVSDYRNFNVVKRELSVIQVTTLLSLKTL